MREKIAEAIYSIASTDRDQFIDEYTLDIRKSRTWDELTKSSKEYWQGKIGQIIEMECEEIEKAGIVSPKELKEIRASSKQDVRREICDQCTEETLKAQLDKILALLK